MAERFLVLPAHVALGQSHQFYADAVGAAVAQVDKDRVPRLVVRCVADVRPSHAPRAEVIAAEAAHG